MFFFFLPGAFPRRDKFANFCHDSIQNQIKYFIFPYSKWQIMQSRQTAGFRWVPGILNFSLCSYDIQKTCLLIISFSKHITLRQNLLRSDQFVAANLILGQVFEAKARKQKQHVKSFQIRYCHSPIGPPHAKTCLRAYADSISAV